MPLGVIIRWDPDGIAPEEYEEIVEELELRSDPPPGLLFHWSEATDEGLDVIYLWESGEQFDVFHAERLLPAIADLARERRGGEVAAPLISERPVLDLGSSEDVPELAAS
jgi:hypothetical protein